MLLRLLTSRIHDDGRHEAFGDEIDVPGLEADRLLAAGAAERVPPADAPPPIPSGPRRPGRPRKER